VLKPRLPALGGPAAARGVGAACVALGVMLSLPIPIFSMLPAFAVLVIALGILAKDGLAVAAGLVAGAAALGTFAAVVWAALAFFGFV
ncbi:MAG: exopolysaccharide biosynthesis protein, partial [Rhodospirillales bacterium]|nr:exopolysaccharide biosynthesis protein [Rhodospirillales bacterium]